MDSRSEFATLTIRFPVALMNRLREIAGQDDRSVGSVVRKIVAKEVEKTTA
jgi:predicted transcriptional regulator